MKKFIHTSIADKRAINLHLKLREIEQMPLIGVSFSQDCKEIVISDRNDRHMFCVLGVETVLGLNPKKAIQNGGTYKALFASWERRKSVPQVVVEEETHSFLMGDE